METYYDRQGKPISWEQFLTMDWNKDRRVAEDTVDGKWVSTVFMPLNYAFDDGPPLIFETMVFESKEELGRDLYQERYSTEAEALEGHARVVAKLKRGDDLYE